MHSNWKCASSHDAIDKKLTHVGVERRRLPEDTHSAPLFANKLRCDALFNPISSPVQSPVCTLSRLYFPYCFSLGYRFSVCLGD